MSEEDTQHKYRESEILIDGARVLSSDFPQIGIVVNGSELEVLRNLLGYASRRKTFVGAYHDNYYLSVDDDDWLDVQAVIGTLERKLMGNDNTIWGYNDRLYTLEDHTTTAPGNFTQSHPVVPSGEIHRVMGVSVLTDGAGSAAGVYAYLSATNFKFLPTLAPAINDWLPTVDFDIIMKVGDGLRFSWINLANNQRIRSVVYGYKMKVEG